MEHHHCFALAAAHTENPVETFGKSSDWFDLVVPQSNFALCFDWSKFFGSLIDNVEFEQVHLIQIVSRDSQVGSGFSIKWSLIEC